MKITLKACFKKVNQGSKITRTASETIEAFHKFFDNDPRFVVIKGKEVDDVLDAQDQALNPSLSIVHDSFSNDLTLFYSRSGKEKELPLLISEVRDYLNSLIDRVNIRDFSKLPEVADTFLSFKELVGVK